MAPLDGDASAITLRYSVRRGEISSWYWTTFFWPDGLWWYWLGTIVVVFAGWLYIAARSHPLGAIDFVAPSIAVLMIFGFYVVYPQLAYKARERTLTVSAVGIVTKIGSITARRSWRDIASITDRGDYIAMVVAGAIPLGVGYMRTRTGNAFIVPNRAFGTDDDRSKYLERVTAWHAAQAKRFPHYSGTRYYAETAA